MPEPAFVAAFDQEHAEASADLDRMIVAHRAGVAAVGNRAVAVVGLAQHLPEVVGPGALADLLAVAIDRLAFPSTEENDRV